MHKPYEVLRGITLPSDRCIITGRVYNWLQESNYKIKPASCVVESLGTEALKLGKLFIRLGKYLMESAGVNVAIDTIDEILIELLTEMPLVSTDCVKIVDSSQKGYKHEPEYEVFTVADQLLLKNADNSHSLIWGDSNYVSIFATWDIAYTASLLGERVILDFARVRHADAESSGRESFMQVCHTILKFALNPSVTSLLKVLSEICSTIKRGSFRRHGAMTTSLQSTSAHILEYLDIPFSYLSHIKKGVTIRAHTVAHFPQIIEKLMDCQNKGEIFFEKALGYSLNTELRSNVCLTGDTFIRTEKSNQRISDLIGIPTKVFDGKNWVETVFVQTSPASEVYSLTLYDGRVIRATGYHEFILTDGTRKKLLDLQQGDVLIESSPSILYGESVKSAYLKGFLCGDGTKSEGRAILQIHENKFCCIPRLTNSLNETEITRKVTSIITTSGQTKVRAIEGENELVVSLQGMTAREIDPAWCNEYKEHLPIDWIINWDITSKSEFLAGLFDADGTAQQGRRTINYVLTSIHRTFLQDVQLLLNSLGITSRITSHMSATNDKTIKGKKVVCQQSWRLWLSQEDSATISAFCNFSRLKEFSHDKPLRKSTSPFKSSSVSSIEFDGIEPVYCCNVPTNNSFTLSNNIRVGNCRAIRLIPGDQCLISVVNFGMCRTYVDIPIAFKEVTEFLINVHELQIQLGHPLLDRQIAVSVTGLANMLRNFGTTYTSFIQMLSLYNFAGDNSIDLSEAYGNNIDYLLIAHIHQGIELSSSIAQKANMRACLAVEPGESCSRRHKDARGFDIVPNIDPPNVVAGVGIERRHSETGVYDTTGELINPEFNYGSDIFVASQLTEDEHFTLWSEYQYLQNRYGMAHGACFEMWHQWNWTSFIKWWYSSLPFVYYNRRVGTKHLEKGSELSARARLQGTRSQKQTVQTVQNAGSLPELVVICSTDTQSCSACGD